MHSEAADQYARLVRAMGDEPMPAALVDLDALEHNVSLAARGLEGTRCTLRVGTKSVRCVALLRRILAALGPLAGGLLAYSPREAEWLVGQGFLDVLVAYPTASRGDALALARANASGASVIAMADCAEHLELLAWASRELGARVPVCLDLDMALRPLGGRVHLGVRRSPLHDAGSVLALARECAARRELILRGAMGYEAHVASLSDRDARGRTSWAHALFKRAARGGVSAFRARVRDALSGLVEGPLLFNGGGTGSLRFSSHDPALTEVTVGSGFLGSHLFDGMDEFAARPASWFALQVVRRASPSVVTCLGGGYVASGAAGPDRLPRPALPPGLSLLTLEGAGEVQTPLKEPAGTALGLGAPVFFRHAKAGELAEHFTHYLLVCGDAVLERVPTYRGQGCAFL